VEVGVVAGLVKGSDWGVEKGHGEGAADPLGRDLGRLHKGAELAVAEGEAAAAGVEVEVVVAAVEEAAAAVACLAAG
jgi:hypothetical protein